MALRVVLSAASVPPPYTCAWLSQRRSVSMLLQPIDLVITEQQLALKSSIVIECGTEEAHSYGFILPYLFRPLLQLASASAPPIYLSVTLKPQGIASISVQWIAQATPSAGPIRELHDGEGEYAFQALLKAYLLHGATVSRVIDDITHVTPRTEDATLLDEFLLAYRAYLWPVQLLMDLRARFEAAEGSSFVRQRIITFVTRWLERHSADFATPSLRFPFGTAEKVFSSGSTIVSKRFIAALQRATAPPSIPQPPQLAFAEFAIGEWRAEALRKHSPLEVAHHMAAIDQLLVNSIQMAELQGLQWLSFLSHRLTSPSLGRHWIASIVLSAPSEQRIAALTWSLHLLKASFQLHNYAGCVSILAGLQKPCVSNLNSLWASVGDTEAIAMHALIHAVFLPDHNWLSLREQQHRVRGPWVPYLAPLLCDLLEVEVDMPHMITSTPPMLNVSKLRNTAALLSQLQAIQHEPTMVPLQLVTSLHDHLLSAPHHSEDQLNALSASVAASLPTTSALSMSRPIVPWLAYLDDTAGITGRVIPPLPSTLPLHATVASSPLVQSLSNPTLPNPNLNSNSNNSSTKNLNPLSASNPAAPFSALLGGSGFSSSGNFSRSSLGRASVGVASTPALASPPISIAGTIAQFSPPQSMQIAQSRPLHMSPPRMSAIGTARSNTPVLGASVPLGGHRTAGALSPPTSPSTSPPTSPRARKRAEAIPPPVPVALSPTSGNGNVSIAPTFLFASITANSVLLPPPPTSLPTHKDNASHVQPLPPAVSPSSLMNNTDNIYTSVGSGPGVPPAPPSGRAPAVQNAYDLMLPLFKPPAP